MSKNANPALGRVWIDGDAYRAPAGTGLPTLTSWSPETVTTGTSDDTVNWESYGGIEAGFDHKPEQKSNKLNIWNYQKGAYDTYTDPRTDAMSFIAVDNSPATIKTRLRGGSIVKKNGLYVEEFGDEEEISLLFLLRRGAKGRGIYVERARLADAPVLGRFTGKELDGWTFNFDLLTPPEAFTIEAPDGVDVTS